MNNNVEIFKECDNCLMQVRELELIQKYSPKYKYYEDFANGYIAFALDVDRNKADELVDELIEVSGGSAWYLGDEEEEYVFVG